MEQYFIEDNENCFCLSDSPNHSPYISEEDEWWYFYE